MDAVVIRVGSVLHTGADKVESLELLTSGKSHRVAIESTLDPCLWQVFAEALQIDGGTVDTYHHRLGDGSGVAIVVGLSLQGILRCLEVFGWCYCFCSLCSGCQHTEGCQQ